MIVLSWLRYFWPVLVVGIFTATVVVNGQGRYDEAFKAAKEV